MKIRKAAAAALFSTTDNSDERFESKKQRVSDERLQLDDDAPETKFSIVVCTGDAKPIACVKKAESCKPRKPREKIYNGPNPSPDIPNEFKNKIQSMGGTDWRLIIQKGLSDTDLSKAHARLSMPSSKWIAEQGLFDSEFGKSGTKNYVSLPLIDTRMKVWRSVSLKKWKLSKAMVVISGGWNHVSVANGLKVKDVVQIWCFKVIETGTFGLAMVKIENGGSNSNDIGSPESLSSSCIHPHSPVTYFDFFATAADSNGGDQELVATDSVVGRDRLGVSSSEDVLLTVVDDIDLSLHL